MRGGGGLLGGGGGGEGSLPLGLLARGLGLEGLALLRLAPVLRLPLGPPRRSRLRLRGRLRIALLLERRPRPGQAQA